MNVTEAMAYLQQDGRSEIAEPVAVLAEELERLESHLDYQTHRVNEAASSLDFCKDRLDDFTYDELSCHLDDHLLDDNGDQYRSKLGLAAAELERMGKDNALLDRELYAANSEVLRLRIAVREAVGYGACPGEGKPFRGGSVGPGWAFGGCPSCGDVLDVGEGGRVPAHVVLGGKP